MGRWSKICCMLVVCVVMGCSVPSLQNGLINSQSNVHQSIPDVTAQHIVPTVSATSTKDPDLPPDKAAKLCLATGEELEKNGHYEKAIHQYELALKHQPRLPGVQKKLAACYAGMKNYDQAITIYHKELENNPKDADLLNDLGYTYYEMEDFKSAEKYLRQAISIKPGMQRAHGNLGLALGRQKRWKESLESFKKAGSPAGAQANLAAMYLLAGEYEQARASCNIALGIDPTLKAAKDILSKLENVSVESAINIQQAEAKLTSQNPKSASEVPVAQAIQLQKPVTREKTAKSNSFVPVSK